MAMELILQGLTNRTHADALREMFVGEVDRSILSVAFVSRDGVDHIRPLLAAHAAKIVVYAGIRNESTSLLDAGRLIDETAAPPPRSPTKAKAGSNDPTPRMKMAPKPVRGKAKAPAAPAPDVPAAAAPAAPAAASTTVAPDLELVWESKPLTRRSLGIPDGPNSNSTGSATLGTETFDGIDRVTYFRDDLFGHLQWALNGTVETADQDFDLVVKGLLLGTFTMTLRHSLTRAAAVAADDNSPTSLSWGDAAPLVAR